MTTDDDPFARIVAALNEAPFRTGGWLRASALIDEACRTRRGPCLSGPPPVPAVPLGHPRPGASHRGHGAVPAPPDPAYRTPVLFREPNRCTAAADNGSASPDGAEAHATGPRLGLERAWRGLVHGARDTVRVRLRARLSERAGASR